MTNLPTHTPTQKTKWQKFQDNPFLMILVFILIVAISIFGYNLYEQWYDYNYYCSIGNYDNYSCYKTTPEQKSPEQKSKSLEKMPRVLKPAIYLYPKTETQIQVSLNFKNQVKDLFVYPRFNVDNNWLVKASTNGDLEIKDQNSTQKFNYLFWESESKQEISFNMAQGEVISGKDSIDYLEQTLTQIGLNDKEKAEFIIYWAPQISKFQNVLIHIATTQEYDNNYPITIDPKPDNFNRLFVVFQELNDSQKENLKIQKQVLPQFNRAGYNALEWGGTIIK